MFSKSIEYAYSIIMFLKEKNRINGKDIVEELNIPEYYGLTILKQLSNAEILNSAKGKTGGFLLNDKEVTFLQLYLAVNHPTKKIKCKQNKNLDENYFKITSKLKEDLMENMKKCIL